MVRKSVFSNQTSFSRTIVDQFKYSTDIEQASISNEFKNDELMYYKQCWTDLHSILSKIVENNPSKYSHFLEDILSLMRYIEWKHDSF